MMLKSADARVNGAAIEAQLRKELGATQPIPFRTFERPTEPGTENPLVHILTWASRGQAPFIHAVVLEMQHPGPWALTVHVVKTAQMFVVGARLAFAAHLRGTVSKPTHLAGNNVWSGDDALSASLNSDAGLRGAIHAQLRPKLQVGAKGAGGFWISMPTMCSILPGKDGVDFALGTMPEVSWTGMSASFHAQEFLQIAGRIQQHLDYVAQPR